MGADIVIAVNVTSLESDNSEGNDKKKDKQKCPNILNIAFQTVNIISSQKLLTCMSEADITINPQVAHIGRGDFHRADEFIYQGELSAMDCEKKLKKLITG